MSRRPEDPTWLALAALAAHAAPTGAVACHGDMIAHPGLVGRADFPVLAAPAAASTSRAQGGVAGTPG